VHVPRALGTPKRRRRAESAGEPSSSTLIERTASAFEMVPFNSGQCSLLLRSSCDTERARSRRLDHAGARDGRAARAAVVGRPPVRGAGHAAPADVTRAAPPGPGRGAGERRLAPEPVARRRAAPEPRVGQEGGAPIATPTPPTTYACFLFLSSPYSRFLPIRMRMFSFRSGVLWEPHLVE
jgi:hypothetical protein